MPGGHNWIACTKRWMPGNETIGDVHTRAEAGPAWAPHERRGPPGQQVEFVWVSRPSRQGRRL
ncbi:hypothetical protein GCM10010383_55320 [Streptomyces lomondensis]|uniref:Uncharacterized protein n=1 Tax=Streptomyces lomondensis TaxID=68229 RepID=A0ABQ2XHQ1_9ACTN|nr:hypothetical protein GCM10010383_55320 [Streptomyces lomondensis]